MPKYVKQRQRIWALYRILYEETNERNALTMGEILDRLAFMDIPAERRAIYDDIKALNETFAENPRNRNGFKIQIKTTKTNPIRYYLVSREFELEELKLIMDSIRVFPYLSKTDTDRITKKIEQLCAKPDLPYLRARDYILYDKIDYRKYRAEESIGVINKRLSDGNTMEKCDFIEEAIKSNKCLSFRYVGHILSTKHNEDGTVKVRRKGKRHDWVSPFALVYMEGKFFLIAVTYSEESETQILTRFRVEKMKDLEIRKLKRQGEEQFRELESGGLEGMKQFFSDAQGQLMEVELLCKNAVLDSILERFGEKTPVTHVSKDLFRVMISVVVNEEFIGWLLGFGADMKVNGPPKLVEWVKRQVNTVEKLYK